MSNQIPSYLEQIFLIAPIFCCHIGKYVFLEIANVMTLVSDDGCSVVNFTAAFIELSAACPLILTVLIYTRDCSASRL